VLSAHPDRVDNKVLQEFPEFLEFKSRRSEKGEPVGTHGEPRSASVASLSPTEAIEGLVSDADDAVAAELLEVTSREVVCGFLVDVRGVVT
jgi:restriction system protein